MKIEIAKLSQTGSLLVAFATSSSTQLKSGKEGSVKLTHNTLSKRLKTALENKEVSPAVQTSVSFRDIDFEGFRHVAVVGLGDENKIDQESVRQAAATIHSAAKSLKVQDVVVHFDGIPSSKKEAPLWLQGLTEGLLLSDYNFNELKSKKKGESEEKPLKIYLATKSTDASLKKALQEGTILGETVNFSRRLGDMPANLMTPTILANTTVQAARGTGLKVTVWDKARIKKERMGGLLGVSMGSAQEPRFIIMEYKGTGAGNKAPIVFVGKGLTFDCGGISIKPSANMEEMKYDMCGGANVIGTMLAIAKLKLKVHAVGLVGSTENMPGPAATKPGDVHTARNGKTFEVNNTDAEGRLVLADALSYATELKPEMIVDAATLTGAMVVALGNIHTGYFTRNEALAEQIHDASEVSGELTWRMPLVDHHVKDMKGTFADLSNISAGKGAGSATAAAFLEQFVGEGIPWAHFDIAGTGWAVGNRLPYCSRKGASGVMVRTFVELAKQY
jgi:leucyl aminopeptidase